MPLHHVKSHYNLIFYYTSTYVERVGVSQLDNACSFIYVGILNVPFCHFFRAKLYLAILICVS